MKSGRQVRRCAGVGLSLLLLFVFSVPNAGAYSVLTHEELIDLAWNDGIRPLLLARFPGATDQQLLDAHAYAYGGSAIQDMGYYPFGNPLFSDLTHYVRTGDFILWLFRNAHTLNEYAFAVGALSHYLGDSIGHSRAVNPATAVEFPGLEREFGPSVTYDESPHGHIRTEFAFDIDELTDEAFAPPQYLKFVGLKVPRKFLEQAFINTYGFDVHEVFGRAHSALRSYRTSVRSFIPIFAQAEVVLHRRQFPPPPQDDAYRIFAARVARTKYERHWSHRLRGPGIRAHLLAVLVLIIPKIGAASGLAIKIPTPDTLEWYLQSVNRTLDQFREILGKFGAEPSTSVALANVDLDTGVRIKPGDYPLTDQTYASLLDRLTSRPERIIPRDVQKNIVDFYAQASDPKGKILKELDVLEQMHTVGMLH